MIAKDSKNLQITLKKEEYQNFLKVEEFLKSQSKKTPTKSDIITFLINDFLMKQEEEKNQKNKEIFLYYQKAINQIKKALKMNNKQLAELLKMNYNTLRNASNNLTTTLKEQDRKNIDKMLLALNIKIDLKGE